MFLHSCLGKFVILAIILLVLFIIAVLTKPTDQEMRDEMNDNIMQCMEQNDSIRGDQIDDFVQRFAAVTVEHMDWRECLKRYDRPNALIYCDPPYECATVDAYESGWSTAETRAFVDAVAECRGKIVVSCYDTDDFQRLRNAGFRVKHFHALTSITPEKSKNTARVETVYYKFPEKDLETVESTGNGSESVENANENGNVRGRKRSKK